jgi:hypothetical protein
MLLFIGLTGWQPAKQSPPKTYTVSLSIDDWRNVLQSQDSSRRILIRTKLPTDETNYCIQTSFSLSQQISTQVGEQIQQEQKEAAKKDSVDKAAHKPKN